MRNAGCQLHDQEYAHGTAALLLHGLGSSSQLRNARLLVMDYPARPIDQAQRFNQCLLNFLETNQGAMKC